MNTEEKREYKANIWKAYVYKFLRNFHFFAGVLIPFFTIWGGISFAQVMILQAIFTFSVFLMEIPTGTVADRFGRKTSLALGGIVSAMGFLIYVLYPSFWIFALGEFVLAIGCALNSGADHALIYDSLKEIKTEKKSKKIFGRYGSLGLFSLMVAAPLGSLIAKYFGLRATMLLTAVPLILATGIALSFKEPKTRKKSEKPDYFRTLKKGLLYFKNHKELKILAFDYISITTLVFFTVWVYQVVLQKFEVSIGWFGFVHAGIVVLEIIVLNSFASFEKFFGGKKKYLLFTSIICGISFLLIAFAQTLWIALVGIGFISLFGLTRKSLFHNYFNKFIESDVRATVLSSISMLYAFIIAIIDIVFGYLVDWNLKYALAIIGVLIILFALFSKVREEHLLD